MYVLASSDAGTLERWRGAFDEGAAIVEVRSADVLPQCLNNFRPHVLLFDVRLSRNGGARAVDKLMELRRDLKVVAVTDDRGEDAELALFLAGARGVCSPNLASAVVRQIVDTVVRGELWIRRALVPKLVDALARNDETITGVTGRFAILTPREIEIARLVGQGASNKRIALQLAIAERTVKAHMTEIFRKTGTDDRVKLALLISRRH